MMACKLEIPANVDSERLAAYLHDHLARMAEVLDGMWRFIMDDPSSACARYLRRVIDAIVEDDRTLRDLMVELGIPPQLFELRPAQDSGVVGRARPGGTHRDRIVELEYLVGGTRARARMWTCVDGLYADVPQYDGDLAWRAMRHMAQMYGMHVSKVRCRPPPAAPSFISLAIEPSRAIWPSRAKGARFECASPHRCRASLRGACWTCSIRDTRAPARGSQS